MCIRDRDILWAYNKGVRLFAFDSEEELNKIAINAKSSKVFCRLQVSNQGANWPLSKKFGCSPEMAKKLMLCAIKKGLIPSGLSFHVGSQQINIDRFNLFFPEKRSFFLENAGQFSVGSPGEVDLFFSRRIGLANNGSIVPIIGGSRISGKIGQTNIGFLNMYTNEVISSNINISKFPA